MWGKTEQGSAWKQESSGDGMGWLSLVQHLEDSAGVANHLWEHWVPAVVKHRLGDEIGDEEKARRLLVFLAGIHDIGKASPAFAQLAHRAGRSELVSAMERWGLTSRRLGAPDMLRHTVTGHVALQEWLVERFDFARARAGALATVVSAHHGSPEKDEGRIWAVGASPAMGDAAWDAVRHEILDSMAASTGVRGVLAQLRDRRLTLLSLVDLSAVVVMADWIASDESRFPYTVGDPDRRLDEAVQDLDLRGPWRPQPVPSAGVLFEARFPRLAASQPTALQLAAVEAAASAGSAPLILIEAPTGAGKSEAAFMAAEVLAGRFGPGGVFVALPTMATSNAMFGRVLRWVESWPGEADPSMWLAHGKASLNDDFGTLARISRVRQVYDENPQGRDSPEHGPARVSAWLHGRRRGLLANVVVGTIDQVLMGALQSRHLALRHLALSSKVVIVDEVHSADVYMRSYLCRVLEYLGAYGTPVVLLSATLPPMQRGELVSAYQRGRQRRTDPPKARLLPGRRPQGSPGSVGEAGVKTGSMGPGPDAYPLITVCTDQVRHDPVEHDARRLAVHLERLDDDLPDLVERVEELVQDGGCIAVMRNTVRRAQEAYDALRERLGGAVELYHSRFLAADRATRERDLVRRLGPLEQTEVRPRRLVVVGTQVLEQSLDVDFDLLITDLAPVDLMIQRIGRLHRHQRPVDARPAALRVPRCLVTGVEDWASPLPTVSDVLTYVNAESQLLRSLAVLQRYLDGEVLLLPQDGPRLVHAAYDPGLEVPEGWDQVWRAAEKEASERAGRSRSKAVVAQTQPPWRCTSLTGWVSTQADDTGETAGRAQVRDSEDGIEVILLRRTADGALRLLAGDFPGDGQELRLPPEDNDETVRQLAACTVALPQALTNPSRWDRTVEELEGSGVADDWQRSRWLAGQLVLVLGSDGATVLNEHRVSYDSERGLDVTRIITVAEEEN